MADAWILFAFLSAIFAALTSIFAKIGIKDVDSNLATALRTVVVLIMAWAMVGIVGSYGDMGDITPRTFCSSYCPDWQPERRGYAISKL